MGNFETKSNLVNVRKNKLHAHRKRRAGTIQR